MTKTVEGIADQVKSLPREEFDEFLSWLSEYGIQNADAWDEEMAHDAQPGGRLEPVLERVRADIVAGRTKPLDEIINNP